MENHLKEKRDEHVMHLWKPFHFEVKTGFDYRLDHPVHNFFYYLVRILFHPFLYLFNWIVFGLKIEGRKQLRALHGSGAVSICNHVHPMDCTFLDFAFLPRRAYYLTLESNFRIPIARHLIRFLGGVPLPGKLRCVVEMFDEMGKAARKGCLVQIYPEGVLKPYSDSLQPFRDGAFHFAVKQNLPVLPAIVTYRKPRGLWRLYKKDPCLTLSLLEPLYPNQDLNKKDATADLMARCIGVMEEKQKAHTSTNR